MIICLKNAVLSTAEWGMWRRIITRGERMKKIANEKMTNEKMTNEKIAVLSDIHGNYIAFQKCLEYALVMGIRTFIFLGDYLGEFPYPQKTMEILYSLKEKYTCFLFL